MTTDEIKIRIRKLLNVAQNDASTEGEIDNAMRFAKSMMDKHHLSEEDLVQEPECQYKQAQAALKSRYWATVGGKVFAWESYLARFVSDFVGVGCYCDDRLKRVARKANGLVMWNENADTWQGKSFCFYGNAEDARLAVDLYYDLWVSIRTMSILKYGTCYTGDGGMYCQGFVRGLWERVDNANRQDRLTAGVGTAMILIERRKDLIAYKQKIGKDWLAEKHGVKIRKGHNNRSGAAGSQEAYNEGKEDGRRAEVSADRRPKLV